MHTSPPVRDLGPRLPRRARRTRWPARLALWALALGAAPALAAPAEEDFAAGGGEAPPQAEWIFSPAHLATDVPVDAVVVVEAEGVPSLEAFQGIASLHVYGPGHVEQAGEVTMTGPAVFQWRPARPFEPAAVYTVELVADGEVEGQWVFFSASWVFRTAGAEIPLPPSPVVGDVRVSAFEASVPALCPPGEGDCPRCCTGTEWQFLVSVALSIDTPEADPSLIARLAIGADEAEARDVLERGGVPVALNVGPGPFAYDAGAGAFARWASDRVCVAIEVLDVFGGRAPVELACTDLPPRPPGAENPPTPVGDPFDGPDDVDAGSDERGGCAASGAASAPSILPLLVLLGLVRRRRRAR